MSSNSSWIRLLVLEVISWIWVLNYASPWKQDSTSATRLLKYVTGTCLKKGLYWTSWDFFHVFLNWYLNPISKGFYISEKKKVEYFFSGFNSFLRIHSSKHSKKHFLFNTFSSILLKFVCFGNTTKEVSWICSLHPVLSTAFFHCHLASDEYKSNAWWFRLTSDDRCESDQ